MGLFGLLNYEDYILNTVVKSSYARNGLVVLLIYLITAMVRFHLAIIICIFFKWNNVLDLIFPVIVTVLLSMASDTLFKYVETHRPRYEELVDYFIANYSRENFIRWKRFLLVGICCYVLLAIALNQVDNYFIFLSTIQTAASFCISDLLENKMPQAWYNRLMDWWHRPRITLTSQKGDIIDNYFPVMRHISINSNNSSNAVPRNNQIHNRRLIKPTNNQTSHDNTDIVYDRGPLILDNHLDITRDEQLKRIKQAQNLTLRKNNRRRSLDSALPLRSSYDDLKDSPKPNKIPSRFIEPQHNYENKVVTPNVISIGQSQDTNLYIQRVSPIPIKPPTPPMMSQSNYPH